MKMKKLSLLSKTIYFRLLFSKCFLFSRCLNEYHENKHLLLDDFKDENVLMSMWLYKFRSSSYLKSDGENDYFYSYEIENIQEYSPKNELTFEDNINDCSNLVFLGYSSCLFFIGCIKYQNHLYYTFFDYSQLTFLFISSDLVNNFINKNLTRTSHTLFNDDMKILKNNIENMDLSYVEIIIYRIKL